MNIEELVRTITTEVIRQMQPSVNTNCCMVLGRRTPLLINRIQELVDNETEIFFYDEEPKSQTICRYILPTLSCNNMADLAAGRAEGIYVKEVLSLLLQGVEVEVLDFDYKRFHETAPGPLFRTYESYQETLKGFGLVPFREKKPDTIRFWKQLITEKTINDVKQEGANTLVVSRTSTITPLAYETAKLLNITIQKSL